MTNAIFLSQKLLSETLFPFLSGEELANISSVNKASEKAAKVDLLWEKLCLNSTDNYYCWEDSWRKHFILHYNWNHGKYRETSKVLDINYYHIYVPRFRKAYGATSTDEGIKIQILETGKEIYLKAPGFTNQRDRFLHNLIITTRYSFIKTDSEIQIYQCKNGELLRAIPVTNPERNPCSLTTWKNSVASVDDGGILRIWNITSGELLLEERFLNKPLIKRNTVDLEFINKTTVRWFWYHLSQTGEKTRGTWDLDLERKSINENGPLDDPIDEQSSVLKKKYDGVRKNKLAQTLNVVPIKRENPNPFLPHRAFLAKYSLKGVYYFNESEWFNLRACVLHFYQKFDYLDKICFSDVQILDEKNSLLFTKRFEKRDVRKIIFTADKMFIVMPETPGDHFSKKSTLITCDFNPNNKPEKHPEHIRESNFTPTFLKETAVQPKTLLQRIVEIAKRMFMFLTYPFKKVAELSVSLLKGTVRIIRTAFARRI